jgi:hypothetical protein
MYALGCQTLFPLAAMCLLLLASCSGFPRAREPAVPFSTAPAAPGRLPDSVLREAIRKSELIVLATPVELASQPGFPTPHIQMGAKETWFDVKLAVDSIAKGKLKRAKHPDLGVLPAILTPPPSFGRLAANEIIVQYPVVTSRKSDWAAAAPLIPGQPAVYLFRRCYYCLTITGLPNPRGGYYKANPLVALGPASKLPPTEWARVARLAREQRGHH